MRSDVSLSHDDELTSWLCVHWYGFQSGSNLGGLASKTKRSAIDRKIGFQPLPYGGDEILISKCATSKERHSMVQERILCHVLRVELYSRTSWVTGGYGSGTEIAGGFNWFILPGQSNLRLTFDVADLESSPAEARVEHPSRDTAIRGGRVADPSERFSTSSTITTRGAITSRIRCEDAVKIPLASPGSPSSATASTMACYFNLSKSLSFAVLTMRCFVYDDVIVNFKMP